MLLGCAAVGLFSVNTNVSALSELPPPLPRSHGYGLLEGHFPRGEVSPVDVVVTDAASSRRPRAVGPRLPRPPRLPRRARRRHGPLQPGPRRHADREPGLRRVRALRATASAVAGTHVVVGGPTAQDLDTASASHHDTLLIVPTVLAVVLIVLWILLRALLGPVLVVLTVVVTFVAALGLAAALFVPSAPSSRDRSDRSTPNVRVPGRPWSRLQHLPADSHARGGDAAAA